MWDMDGRDVVDLIGVFTTLEKAKAALFKSLCSLENEYVSEALWVAYDGDEAGCFMCVGDEPVCSHVGVECDDCREPSIAECGCGWKRRHIDDLEKGVPGALANFDFANLAEPEHEGCYNEFIVKFTEKGGDVGIHLDDDRIDFTIRAARLK